MARATSRVFKSGNSLAVRLPRDIAFEAGTEVAISRSGDTLTIVPTAQDLKGLVERLQSLPRPASIQERDIIEVPDREGL